MMHKRTKECLLPHGYSIPSCVITFQLQMGFLKILTTSFICSVHVSRGNNTQEVCNSFLAQMIKVAIKS